MHTSRSWCRSCWQRRAISHPPRTLAPPTTPPSCGWPLYDGVSSRGVGGRGRVVAMPHEWYDGLGCDITAVSVTSGRVAVRLHAGGQRLWLPPGNLDAAVRSELDPVVAAISAECFRAAVRRGGLDPDRIEFVPVRPTATAELGACFQNAYTCQFKAPSQYR
ncbi:hypothetical protein AB1Y20_009148 [Prymnesium parvum]|uniref:Uncharacterized protein n=1 Tax=Prymnesium parvum TaxID=97485 RepID=A0AB34JZW4_PRYPA